VFLGENTLFEKLLKGAIEPINPDRFLPDAAGSWPRAVRDFGNRLLRINRAVTV